MNIFKKFFNLFKKKEKKQEACWYNNVDEQEILRPAVWNSFGMEYLT